MVIRIYKGRGKHIMGIELVLLRVLPRKFHQMPPKVLHVKLLKNRHLLDRNSYVVLAR